MLELPCSFEDGEAFVYACGLTRRALPRLMRPTHLQLTATGTGHCPAMTR